METIKIETYLNVEIMGYSDQYNAQFDHTLIYSCECI